MLELSGLQKNHEVENEGGKREEVKWKIEIDHI